MRDSDIDTFSADGAQEAIINRAQRCRFCGERAVVRHAPECPDPDFLAAMPSDNLAALTWRYGGSCPNCRHPIEVDLPALPAEKGYVLVNAEGLAAALREVGLWPQYPEWTNVWGEHAAAILAAIQEQER